MVDEAEALLSVLVVDQAIQRSIWDAVSSLCEEVVQVRLTQIAIDMRRDAQAAAFEYQCEVWRQRKETGYGG